MNQILESTLPARQIVLRQVQETSNENIEENAGLWYPLVLILDKVFHQEEIQSFNYEIGQDLLPSISVTIEDEDKTNREDIFPELDDIMTIFINNSVDEIHVPIHIDFLITGIDSIPEIGSVTYNGVHYVPKLHERNNKAWQDTSFNILKEIAEECGLGLVSNITDTNDSSLRICRNNYFEFIKELERDAYVSDDDCLKIFIDQFNNLNVISLKSALSDRTDYDLQTNPATGEALDGVTIKVSNNTMKDEEFNDSENDVSALDWAPESTYGRGWVTNKNAVTYIDKSDEKHLNSQESETEVVSQNSLENTSDMIASNNLDLDLLHDSILRAPKQNARMRNILNQGTYIRLLLDYYTPDMFVYMHFRAEIFNVTKNEEYHSQDENEDIDQAQENAEGQPARGYSLNETFTSSYIAFENAYRYDNSEGKIRHYIRAKKVE